MPSSIPYEELYKFALDEYRFNVSLGWDRAKYYVLFNSAIVSVGTGLLTIQQPEGIRLLVALLFVSGCVTCWIGASAVKTAHSYYRASIYKKTLIEQELGLGEALEGYSYIGANLSVATTKSQTERHEILHNTEEWMNRGLRRGTVVYRVRAMLSLLLAVDIGGAGFAITLFFGPSVAIL